MKSDLPATSLKLIAHALALWNAPILKYTVPQSARSVMQHIRKPASEIQHMSVYVNRECVIPNKKLFIFYEISQTSYIFFSQKWHVQASFEISGSPLARGMWKF